MEVTMTMSIEEQLLSPDYRPSNDEPYECNDADLL